MKQLLINHIKNIPGWRTNRKLVVFSVDDYGNIRIASKEARDNIDKVVMKSTSHFDTYDNLETREDLEALYEVLTSVKDMHGNSAIFTPYALPCNIDFETMAENKNNEYIYELLPQTFEKLSAKDANAYEGTWRLWQEGIKKGLMKPQFHGREHFNLHIFNDLLSKKNKNITYVLKQGSYVTIPEHIDYKQGWTASYSFDKLIETDSFFDNVKDGIKRFEEVYGYAPKVFTPPAQQFPLHLENNLPDLGVKYMDSPRLVLKHLGESKYKTVRHKLGDGELMTHLVRNVLFEPTVKSKNNWVDFTLKEVEATFRMKKPANISGHRVNYCGYIDEENRKVGLSALKQLLQEIVDRWPDVEFISADQLGDIISENK
jgi:hypothetical protein